MMIGFGICLMPARQISATADIAQKVSNTPRRASFKKGDCEASFFLKLPIPYGFLRFSHCHARPCRIAQSCIFLSQMVRDVLRFYHKCDRRTYDSSFTFACFLNRMLCIKKSAANAGRQRSNSFHTAFCMMTNIPTVPRELLFIISGVKCSPGQRQDCDKNPILKNHASDI